MQHREMERLMNVTGEKRVKKRRVDGNRSDRLGMMMKKKGEMGNRENFRKCGIIVLITY